MSRIQDTRRIDRRIGWIMSVGGAALLLGQAPIMLATSGDYPTWWNLGVAVLAVTVLGLAALGWALPHTLLTACWRVAPILGALLMLIAFASYQGPQPPETLPWILSFDAVISAYLLLWLPPWAATTGTVLGAALVPLSALLFLGEIPHVVWVAMPIHMSNIVFIAIFVGIRRRMTVMRAAERAAVEGRARQMQASINAEHQEHVSRLLHDEVISALTAAFRARGTPSPQLRAEARRALDLLESPPPAPTTGAEPCETALHRLEQTVLRIDPECRIKATSEEGALPVSVADAIIGAVGEAMRNSLRHAGPGATRTLLARAASTSFEVIVLDDGTGFERDLIRSESLGIDRSIIGRMRGIPGGGATVTSRPGGPTMVELTWRT
ncbi:MAG: sensor histidine kinase [Leucobacter sp.]